jgi:hypothetical protein
VSVPPSCTIKRESGAEAAFTLGGTGNTRVGIACGRARRSRADKEIVKRAGMLKRLIVPSGVGVGRILYPAPRPDNSQVRSFLLIASRNNGHNRAEQGLLNGRPMEIRDGFIVGIFNYCDSWCAACAFTSRCRVFAAMAEDESAADPNLKAIAEAPLLPQDIPPPPPESMQELLQEMNRAAREARH